MASEIIIELTDEESEALENAANERIAQQHSQYTNLGVNSPVDGVDPDPEQFARYLVLSGIGEVR